MLETLTYLKSQHKISIVFLKKHLFRGWGVQVWGIGGGLGKGLGGNRGVMG